MFYAGLTTSYAHICTMESDKMSSENNIYGISGGLNEFPLMGNYDDGTERILSGEMWQMKHPEDIEDGHILTLKPDID